MPIWVCMYSYSLKIVTVESLTFADHEYITFIPEIAHRKYLCYIKLLMSATSFQY